MPDTRYNLLTDDGAYIYIQTRGTRTGPKEILDQLTTDPTITADKYRYVLRFLRLSDYSAEQSRCVQFPTVYVVRDR